MESVTRVFTIRETAKELRLSISLTYRLVSTGQLRAIKAGDRWLVPAAAEVLSIGV